MSCLLSVHNYFMCTCEMTAISDNSNIPQYLICLWHLTCPSRLLLLLLLLLFFLWPFKPTAKQRLLGRNDYTKWPTKLEFEIRLCKINNRRDTKTVMCRCLHDQHFKSTWTYLHFLPWTIIAFVHLQSGGWNISSWSGEVFTKIPPYESKSARRTFT